MVKLSNKIGWTQGTTKQQIFYKEKGEDSAAIFFLTFHSLPLKITGKCAFYIPQKKP